MTTFKRTIFFNVLTGSISGMFAKSEEEISSSPNVPQSVRWYNKSVNPVFYEPSILISCPHNRNKKEIRKDMMIDDDCFVFVDSGGFQLATQVVTEKEYTREIALEWSEKHGDVFPILDMPVSSGNRTPQETLDFSVKSAKYYYENRQNPHCFILNVLSANRHSNMEHWYNSIKDFKFNGWAYGGHKNYAKAIIQSILFLESKGEFKRAETPILHMFGTTSFAVLPYILYAQYLLDKMDINCLLTFDSSSASALANYGKYILTCAPTGITNLKISNKDFMTKNLEGKTFGCDCPVCKGITDLDYLFSDQGKWQYYSLLAIHNYYKMNQFKRDIEHLFMLDCKETLHSFPTFMVKNFKAMDKAFKAMGKKGIHIIENEFNIDSKAKPIELSGSTNSLSAFLN